MSFTPTSITMADAGQALREGLASIAQGETLIDLSGLARFDSSAVSAVLAWKRAGSALGRPLQIAGVPKGLLSLAQLYGLQDLMHS
ncbi:MAG: binding protein involved in toluene tolerance [Pseudomonadota bacterium]|jgi:phospholipid transport system transporter-binding protein